MVSQLQTPPLSLYIHMPWCVVKCPYCDFNSHALTGTLPESDYIDALLLDLELDLPHVWGRIVHSIFIGGGTPSLMSASAIDRLLSGIRARVDLSPNAEITLEANPGVVEHDRFEAYRSTGINRISLGIQSFHDHHLKTLGRVHSAAEAHQAIEWVQRAGFERLNLDLMWALPNQTPDEALHDIRQALDHGVDHISHYQLTIEPNTVFHAKPPVLPQPECVDEISEVCAETLREHDFDAYEISAWTRDQEHSRHNLNYWHFGDYLGIGAGAHGKITLAGEGQIMRLRRTLTPRSYLAAARDSSFIAQCHDVAPADRAFEYFLNRLRLAEPIAFEAFEQRTGLSRSTIEAPLEEARQLELVELSPTHIVRTHRGARYLNDLQQLFLD